ncbi:MAG TPA: element excision factor XisH family protein [Blastocatellia bacterium]|nr:element excision factor XisH family protein [Blastocatellia bacterium]
MAAKDKFHEIAKNARSKDGWDITHDPLRLKWAGRPLLIDLGAEPLVAAEKGTRKIAVEIKSFIRASVLDDFYHALGQFIFYRKALQTLEPDRELYLAIRESVYLKLFLEQDIENLRAEENLKLLVFNPKTEEIIKWIE